jgi:predicted O-methyltransferase YrrM
MDQLIEYWRGFYATEMYIPFSLQAKRFRGLSSKLRGKKEAFYQKTSLPDVDWREVASSGNIRLTETGKKNGNVRISELALLSHMARSCPEHSTLFEIGTFDGRTTLNLAINAPLSCPIFTLDLPPGQETAFDVEAGERHFIEKPEPGLRYRNCAERYTPYTSRITQLLGDSGKFDFSGYKAQCALVFVDGSHAYEYAMSDSFVAMGLIQPGGVIVWHDYGVWEGVTKALEALEEQESLGLQHIRGTSLVYWKCL